MTAKDYKLIATVLETHTVNPQLYWAFVTVFERKDPKFDRQKFLTACGIEVAHCKRCDRTNIDYNGVCPNHR